MAYPLNPFIYGRALNASEFIGRTKELVYLNSRLATGQSLAIIGQPHVGKTSLLRYILEPEARQTLFGSRYERDCFSYLDAQMLRGVQTQPAFWEQVFHPFEDHLLALNAGTSPGLSNLYQTAKQNQFGTFVLEQLFEGLKRADMRLFLLLDEFDDILAHPKLNSAEFYGSLRALASHSGGLVLVIAARQSLELLNQQTQAINPHGSPYFNIFTEMHLGCLSSRAFNNLMRLAGESFTTNDYRYIERVSGRQPYLAQITAAALWDSLNEGKSGAARFRSACRNSYRQAHLHFSDTWRVWNNPTRKALTAIGLAQIPRLLANHEFLVSELIDDLDDFSPELDELELNGIISKTETGEWEITQDAFLWWLADELRRNVRDDSEFKTWLQSQEIEFLLTGSEKERLGKAARKVLEISGKGATTLIDTLAKGYGEGLSKGFAV